MFLPLLLSCSLSSAITLGRVVVADPLLGSRSIIYEQINGFAVVEGDILVAKIADLRRFRAVIRHKIGGSRWPGGIIPFEIAEDLPFKNKLAVLQAIAHWQEKTSIKFVELTSKNRHDYRDYVVFFLQKAQPVHLM
ncbi:M12 family metallopeptidase [Legionella tunisiensis]|uniref:M12 family metallopeptidase n=1 Tax=Legionella tunisiensis TaxID=1034944 RepID=UPI0002FDF237|nr:M12 family metallopeptidase [Legionella tunisiensis]